MVEACFFKADFRAGLAGASSGASTKYEPSTMRVMGTEQLPADLMALYKTFEDVSFLCFTWAISFVHCEPLLS